MKYEIYKETIDNIEKFAKAYYYLKKKLEKNWRINELDKRLIEIVEEYDYILDIEKKDLQRWEIV